MGTPTRILLVDDEADVRFILGLQMGRQGWQAVEAESGEAALELMDRGEDFDAVVLDHRMDGLSGIDVAARLRAAGDRTPIVMYTGNLDEDLRRRADDIGIGVIPKADVTEVIDALLVMTGGRRRSR